MDEKLIKQTFDARMKRRRIELEAKCGLEFSTVGGGVFRYPPGLRGRPLSFSLSPVAEVLARHTDTKGCRGRLGPECHRFWSPASW
jgi:hypothetical protein